MKIISKRLNLISSILFLVVVSFVKGMDFNEQITPGNSLDE